MNFTKWLETKRFFAFRALALGFLFAGLSGALVQVVKPIQKGFFTEAFAADSIAKNIPESRAMARPDWSILIYGAIDEEELAAYADPILKQVHDTAVGENLEILMEVDTDKTDGRFRSVRQGSEIQSESSLPEADSADPKIFAEFLAWGKANAHGRHTLLLVVAHSWGWKGIIQDFKIPNAPGKDTMMTLKQFSDTIVASGLHFDVAFLDACILGNVEVVEALKRIADYLSLAQRETPLNGFPYENLFSELAKGPHSPGEVAAMIPSQYAAAYTRGGALAKPETEYFETTMVSVDISLWDNFVKKFKGFVQALDKTGFHEWLKAHPDWNILSADIVDSNADVVDLLQRLDALNLSAEVSSKSRELVKMIGYPETVERESEAALSVGADISSIDVKIQGDENLVPTPDEDHPEIIVPVDKQMRIRWEAINQDLVLPNTLKFEVLENTAEGRVFHVYGPVKFAFRFRAWMPGAHWVKAEFTDKNGKKIDVSPPNRTKDFVSVGKFPPASFLVAEAHAQGAPLIHALGIHFSPRMTEKNEERSFDPTTGKRGPAMYADGAWNKATGWGDLVLLYLKKQDKLISESAELLKPENQWKKRKRQARK